MSKKIDYYDGDRALAFPDVYLKPTFSDIKSRYGDQVNTSTSIAVGAPKLNIPIVTAGMDTVTEDKMATVIALNGGIGEIHRNNTPDAQADLVKLVKEKMRVIETDPPKLTEENTIGDALRLLEKRSRGYVIVVSKVDKDKIMGIATDKDFLVGQLDTKLKKVMTPLKEKDGRTLITVDKEITLDKAYEIMVQKRVEKLPIVDSKGNIKGVYTIKDYKQFKDYPHAATDDRGRLVVGAAIGVHQIDIERALKVVEAGADVLFIDIAHGHSVYSKEMVKRLKVKEKIKTPIVVGNIATKVGAEFAYEIGADGVKVGIGPGFVCKTRSVAGTGVPQITAVMEAREFMEKKRKKIPINSDGGIREPGDVGKAIAAGADSLMIGSLFSGTDASPGDFVKVGGTLQKRVRGMASKGALEDRKKLSESTTKVKEYAAEGRETFTPYQGSTEEIIKEYVGGLRSAMSYSGSHSIKELQEAKLLHISGHGANEHGRPLGTG